MDALAMRLERADFSAVTDCLQQGTPTDYVYLLTTILVFAHRIIGQGRRVILNWVANDIGIRGNQVTDTWRSLEGKPLNDMII